MQHTRANKYQICLALLSAKMFTSVSLVLSSDTMFNSMFDHHVASKAKMLQLSTQVIKSQQIGLVEQLQKARR